MNEFTQGKLTVLRDLLSAAGNQIHRDSIARILTECLHSEHTGATEEIRDFIRQLRDNGVTIDCILRYVGDHFKAQYKTIADILGVSDTTISRALHGDVRKCLIDAIDRFIGEVA